MSENQAAEMERRRGQHRGAAAWRERASPPHLNLLCTHQALILPAAQGNLILCMSTTPPAPPCLPVTIAPPCLPLPWLCCAFYFYPSPHTARKCHSLPWFKPRPPASPGFTASTLGAPCQAQLLHSPPPPSPGSAARSTSSPWSVRTDPNASGTTAATTTARAEQRSQRTGVSGGGGGGWCEWWCEWWEEWWVSGGWQSG